MAKKTERSAANARPAPPFTLKRALVVAVLTVAAVFAVQGGEWGTTDLIKQRSRLARSRHDVDSLQREVDSLKVYKKAIETDPLLQERIAREEFGMVKGNKEMLYRFIDPSPAEAAARAKAKR